MLCELLSLGGINPDEQFQGVHRIEEKMWIHLVFQGFVTRIEVLNAQGLIFDGSYAFKMHRTQQVAYHDGKDDNRHVAQPTPANVAKRKTALHAGRRCWRSPKQMIQHGNHRTDQQTYQHRTYNVGYQFVVAPLKRIAQSLPLIQKQNESHDEAEHDVDQHYNPIRCSVSHGFNNGH